MTSTVGGYSSGAAIAITQLRHTFTTSSGPVTVFDEVNGAIEGGEFVAILGPSGCGKSTLLRIVAGLLRPSAGSISIDRLAVTKPSRDIGMVFQEDPLLEWRTVIQNVLLPAEIKGLKKRDVIERASELLGQVGLGDFLDARPSQLSGGMKQRVAICQALAYEPRLLLMDEPFGALDALTRRQMQFDLQDLWTGIRNTVLFVTHGIDEAVLLADRVLVMSPRPSRIVKEYMIDLPRPRTSGTARSAEYLAIVKDIEDLFETLGVLHDEKSAAAGGARHA